MKFFTNPWKARKPIELPTEDTEEIEPLEDAAERISAVFAEINATLDECEATLTRIESTLDRMDFQLKSINAILEAENAAYTEFFTKAEEIKRAC